MIVYGRSGKFGVVNCGIGGDSTQNVLWRSRNLVFPNSIKYVFVHSGTNNLEKTLPIEIVNGIIAIGICCKQKNENLTVLLSGLLPRG